MITAGRLASRWLACGSPIVNVPQSQRAGSGAGASCSEAPGAHDRVRALACVADVVRVAAREQDDIAATHALDVRVAVDPKHEFALFNDVQGANIGEADRESRQRSVRNDPFSAQTDAPKQLREQVVRLAMCVEAERGVLERWGIGKLSRRSEQIGWRRWTIGKMFRRSGHCFYAFLGLRSTNSEWSDQSVGLGPGWVALRGVTFFRW